MIRAPVLFTSRQFITCRSLSSTPSIARSASAALAMEELQPKPKPYSEVPTPGGAVPLLGHVPLMRRNPGTKRFELFGRLFKELGPIFKFKLPGMNVIKLKLIVKHFFSRIKN